MGLFDLVPSELVQRAVKSVSSCTLDEEELLAEIASGESIPSRAQLKVLAPSSDDDGVALRALAQALAEANAALALKAPPDDLLRIAGDPDLVQEWLRGREWPCTQPIHERLLGMSRRIDSSPTEPPARTTAKEIPDRALEVPVVDLSGVFADLDAAFDALDLRIRNLYPYPGRDGSAEPACPPMTGAALAPKLLEPAQLLNNGSAHAPAREAREESKRINRVLADALRALGKPRNGNTWVRAKQLLATGMSVADAARLA